MNTLELSILLPAFAAGLIVLSTHILLGQEVLRRGIIFIDLAIAQFAALGIIIAGLFELPSNGLNTQLFAIASAFFGASILAAIEKKSGNHQEAIIGVSFVLSATAALILLASEPHGGEQLHSLLAGQILWVNWTDLIAPAALSLCIIYIWALHKQHIHNLLFYLVFSLAITTSVQLVGVYLVFASLIIPALGSIRYKHNNTLIAFISGALGYLFGLYLSSALDLPSGPVIVWCIALCASISFILSRINH